VRFFPLVNLKNERASAVSRLLDDHDLAQYQISIEKVDYEFIRNGNEMLVIRRRG
jgi:hypothetical protein